MHRRAHKAYPVPVGAIADPSIFFKTKDVAIVGPDSEFVVVGGNITSAYESYNKKQLERHTRFFEILDEAQLHPHLAFTLARISGFAKLRFYASVTPPEFSEGVITEYNKVMFS